MTNRFKFQKPNARFSDREVTTCLGAFVEDEAGSTVTEYGLIASLLSAAILPLVNALGIEVNEIFAKILAAMS